MAFSSPTGQMIMLIDYDFIYAERLLLQCPRLESVHASGCQKLLIGAIQRQVNIGHMESLFYCLIHGATYRLWVSLACENLSA